MLSVSQSFSKLLSGILLIAFAVLISCEESAVVDKTVHQGESPEVLHARAWADTTLARMSLPEKVGQLMMLTAPKDELVPLALFVDVLKEYHIGGIVLSPADRQVQSIISETCQHHASSPLWVAMDADAEWSFFHGYPDLLGLGAIDPTDREADSLVFKWGQAIGNEAKSLGAQICFTSATKLSPQGRTIRNSPGSDPDRVTGFSGMLLSGLQGEGVQPCLRSLPETGEFPLDSMHHFPEFDEGIDELLAGPLLPLHTALQNPKAFVQSSFAIFRKTDSVSAAFSAQVNQLMMRTGLRYKNPIFSPSFDDPWFSTEYGPGEAEIRALEAGVDVIVQPSDPVATCKAIAKAVEEGRLTTEQLDDKVRRILYQKALAGLDTRPAYQPSPLLLDQNTLAFKSLNWEISKSTLTLLRDRKRRIPLRNNIEEAKIATLAIGERSKTPVQSAMDDHAAIDHFTLGSKPSAAACKTELARLKKYEYVLLSLHPSLTQLADTLPGPVRSLLSQLNAETRLVVSHFGNVNALADLDTLDCVLVAYDDREITQKAVGQMIWGGLAGKGRLPIQIAEKYCPGDGLQCARPIRLEYVEPEALGIAPLAIARIDSVINTAIWTGAFPGCQVLAARDGKVFLNKSYGFHDYDHTRRVRNSDLYDIASITKIASTTLMAMRAYEEDTLKLLMPLRYYLEELDSNFVTIKDITITDLMIHQAGLPPGLPVYKYYTMIDSVDSLRSRLYSNQRDDSAFTVRITDDLYFNRNYLDTIWNRVRLIPLNPVKEYKYSDVSMFLMKAVLERIYDKGLDTLVRNHFYRPLGLQTACYHPTDRFDLERLVPTERDKWWRKKQLKGYVHDHSTALFGGVGGQAGVFSDAQDLAIIMQMLLNGGTYGGKRYFKQSTVEKFTNRQPGSHRGLGFDMQRPVPVPGKGYNCISASPRTFGHFGFTGTCVWADPENGVIYVMLTNRVYPKANNWTINSLRVRQSVQQAIYDALGLTETYCEDVEIPADSLTLDSIPIDSLLVDSVDEGV